MQPSTCCSSFTRRYVFYDFRANEKGQFELSNWVLWLPPPKCEIMLRRIMGIFQGLPLAVILLFFGGSCDTEKKRENSKIMCDCSLI